MINKFKYRALPGGVAGLQVGEEGEPEETTETNIDGTEARRDELEVDSGEESPDANTSLEIRKN